MTGVSEHLHCALCDSKILDDDQKVACKRCGKYLCSYCTSATDRCCADDQPPVLTPVGDVYVCREVHDISLGMLIFILLVVSPALQWWCMQENERFMRSRLSEVQYEQWWEQEQFRRIRIWSN